MSLVDARPTPARVQSLKTAGVQEIPSVCPYCAVGCGMLVGVKDGKIVNISASERRCSLTAGLRGLAATTVLDINAMVANLAPILHALMRENIDLVLALAPDLGYVKVDPTQMEQVIIYLAVNARDAMPP